MKPASMELDQGRDTHALSVLLHPPRKDEYEWGDGTIGQAA
jgi:hypothetical protein